MSNEEFKQYMALSKKLEDHINAVNSRADWFKSNFYKMIREKHKGNAE
jgi:hypothetical protein